MYEKGLLKTVDAPCDEMADGAECPADPWDDGHGHDKSDARSREAFPLNRVHYPCAYLPHSCDEWIIGGPHEVKRLIEDLEAVLHEWGIPRALMDAKDTYDRIIDR